MATELRGPKQADKLKPLIVAVYRGGRVVRTIELDDPRAEYVKQFNRQAKKFGLRAKAG